MRPLARFTLCVLLPSAACAVSFSGDFLERGNAPSSFFDAWAPADSLGSLGNANFGDVRQDYGTLPYTTYPEFGAAAGPSSGAGAFLSSQRSAAAATWDSVSTLQSNQEFLENEVEQTAKFAAMISEHAASMSQQLHNLGDELRSRSAELDMSTAPAGSDLFTPQRQVADQIDAFSEVGLPVDVPADVNMLQQGSSIPASMFARDSRPEPNTTKPRGPRQTINAAEGLVEGSNSTYSKCGGALQPPCNELSNVATFGFNVSMSTGILGWVTILFLVCLGCGALVQYFFRGLLLMVCVVILCGILFVMYKFGQF